MKALTICQPYAALIARGEKRVENRRWATKYRGPLVIHAGKSREWLTLSEDGTCDEDYDIPLAEMQFGAIVAVCDIVDCIAIDAAKPIGQQFSEDALRIYPWLRLHEHAVGPYGFILDNVRALAEPIPRLGALGFFEVKDELIAGAKFVEPANA